MTEYLTPISADGAEATEAQTVSQAIGSGPIVARAEAVSHAWFDR